MTHDEKRLRGYEAAAKTLDKAIRSTRETHGASDGAVARAILEARLSSLVFARALLALGEFPDEQGNSQQIEKALRKPDGK